MQISSRWVALLALSLTVAACGGSDSEPTSVASSPETGGLPAPAETSLPAAEAAPAPPAAAAPVTPAPALAAPPASAEPAPLLESLEPQGRAPDPAQVKAVDVATGLHYPWALAFLPDGRMLVTERSGQLRLVTADGVVSPPLAGLPALVTTEQGGLLDLVLSPTFAVDHQVYMTFVEAGADGGNHVAVARATFAADQLVGTRVIFRQSTSVDNGLHYGSRIVFGRDGNLFVTFGERNDNWAAQRLDSHLGKVIRIATDGSVPADNPYLGTPGALPEIWSIGHRNPQGAALHPVTGDLWLVEHGPRGGDELNLVLPGRNYGWPRIGFGRHYDTGLPVGDATTAPDVESPRHYWAPTSVSPSGLTFYTGTAVPAWRGSAFAGALSTQSLMRIFFDGERVAGFEDLLIPVGERIRDARMGPDGQLYLLTDSGKGRILRVVAD